LKQIEIDYLIVPLILNPLIFPESSAKEIDTLFDPDQRDGINLPTFFTKQNRPERVSNEMDVSHERMGKKSVRFVDHLSAFQ
jgi:hypothetical protein